MPLLIQLKDVNINGFLVKEILINPQQVVAVYAIENEDNYQTRIVLSDGFTYRVRLSVSNLTKYLFDSINT
jgi:hypothetical protein